MATLIYVRLAHAKPPAVAAACCAVLAKAAGPCGMVGGQMDDVAAEQSGRVGEWESGSEESARQSPLLPLSSSPALLHIQSIHCRKTGAMICASLRMGAVAAGANSEQIAALDAYAQRLGLAFQITDDLLDVQSNETAMGKRVGKDARKGKLTFPGLLGLDQSTQLSQQLILEASEALRLFGVDAGGLQAVARFVLERNR